LVLQVNDINGQWLWLSNGKPGWLEQKKVVPLNRGAIDKLTAVIKVQDATSYMRRANVWMHLDELDIALSDLNEAIRLDADAASPYLNRGRLWARKREYEKAVADFNETIRLNPKSVAAYNNRGNAWSDMGEYDKAIVDFNEVLRLDQKFTAAYNNRGIAWEKKQEYDKAIADYNELLRLDPKHFAAYTNIAWLRATCPNETYRDGKEAVEFATKACELTQFEDANNLGTLAAAYAEAGDFEQAVKWQQKVYELAPADQKADVQSRIDLYREGKPYRDEPKP
jgi:tetratricopeptide (TPR) repeat protein